MVRAWREKVVIPTYEVGRPEKNPVFLENRVYQGSSGVVYPYPVIESVANGKSDHEYHAIWIENEYIRVLILPELGGRIQMAYDKIRQRHFIYYNHVIKPALVGLAGPWISGGIEFNWPQHHLPSTFMPVDSTIEQHSDGSVTVWCGERERMFHQKCMTGFTLYPGCAYLEINGLLYNPTEMPQTFLWWANPAVHVNDHYQSVFPPDVNAVFDHGKRAVSSFPIATGTYYKIDYSAGVDISNYKNIHVPTSYMVAHSDYDFEGGYENDTKAGMLHVANHRLSPGKKQWTGGNGDFGRAWDRNLTDDDGPYSELMAGVFTENQPDFSWLMPYEEKSFVQYFFPYRELGVVKNASRDLVLNLTPRGNSVRIQVYATSRQSHTIKLKTTEGIVLFSEKVEMAPETVFDRDVYVDTPYELLVLEVGRISCRAVEPHNDNIPAPAEAALLPSEIDTCEQLYLTGLHLEQYRHATWSAVEYYEEALRRDVNDVRNNNALGLWYLRRGRFEKAEPYLRRAVCVLQKRNPNPYDGEPLYNLALCLLWRSRCDDDNEQLLGEAYDWFYKSTWNAAWQDAGWMSCAQISMMQGRWDDALEEVDRSLIRNWHNHKARMLKCAILRHLHRECAARAFIAESLTLDRFNYGCRFESILLGDDDRDGLNELMRGDAHNYNELALDYLAAGLKEEADAVWAMAESYHALDVMGCYYGRQYDKARLQWVDGVFPNRLEAIKVLKDAPDDDGRAPYLLGNLWYDKRQYELAGAAWEQAAQRDPLFPTVWRNLALYYYNKQHLPEKALSCMMKAFALDDTDARVMMEYDQLRKRLQHPPGLRLALYERYECVVTQRDDLVLEKATLLNLLGRCREAAETLDSRVFHPWEGGEGKVPAQYQSARVQLAAVALSEDRPAEAVKLLEECLVYPPHLGEGKLYGAQEQDFFYLLGRAFAHRAAMCETEDERLECLSFSHIYFEKASQGDLKPVAALYYNDAKPEKIFYQGLALKELGRTEEAVLKFQMLVDYGWQHQDDKVTMDYFAVSLPDLAIWDESLDTRNRVHCLFMQALGMLGFGKREEAEHCLSQATALDNSHVGIAVVRCLLNNGVL